MTNRSLISPALLGWIAVTTLTTTASTVFAQAPPPPLPPPAFEDEEADVGSDEPPAPAEPTAAEPAAAEPPPPPPAPAAAQPEPWEQPVGETNRPYTTDLPDESSTPSSEEARMRAVALRRMTTLNGSTGLHRVSEAGSGAPGTFRINLIGGYFAKKNFLCRDDAICTDPVTNKSLGSDSARRTDAIVAITATPFSFLEASLTIQNSATSNSNGTPELLQVVGDTHLGLKAFTPEKPDGIFSFGGETDLYLLTGTGGVGLSGGATSLAIRGLATMNLNNRTNEEDRIPLRAHLNLGYNIDNSSVVVRDLEETAAPEGRGAPIQRTERYGLGLSRVDAFQIGLGTEYINPYLRPFLEWTMDVPVNRQGYICNIQSAELRGDECLGVSAGFATSPSRLTLGTRLFPWQASGLALTGAVDIGTSGTKRFLEETTPETPYTLWFGLGYAVDTVPPPKETVQIAAPMGSGGPEIRRYIAGTIVEAKERAAIPDAIVRYDGVPMTGLVANADGQFISQDLPPGEYTFKIFADQFREGSCSVSIPETAGGAAPQAAAADGLPPMEGADAEAGAAPTASMAPYMEDATTLMVPVECELKEMPRVADVTGLLVDSVSGGAVPDGKVRITDMLNRSLELAVDAQGSFQFRNVPFGEARLTVSAPGYLTTVTPIKIESREALKPHVLMNPRPAKLDLRIGRNEITLARQIQFVADSAEVAIDSMAMVEQLAAALAENEQLQGIEIQVHTDDTGSASYSRRLSQQRADRIVELLVQLGIPKRRLRARGYGPDQPLAPNVSEANRAMNNRVQVMID